MTPGSSDECYTINNTKENALIRLTCLGEGWNCYICLKDLRQRDNSSSFLQISRHFHSLKISTGDCVDTNEESQFEIKTQE